jgi:cobalt/nickel transport system permease protein
VTASAPRSPPRAPAADPRVRLAVALASLALALAAPRPATALTVAAAAAAGLLARRRFTPLSLAPLLTLALPAAALAAWLTPGRPAWSIGLGGAAWSLSRPGVDRAALLLARVLASSLVVRWLASGLPLAELAGALHGLGVPAPIVELLLHADRQRHALAERFDTLRAAQALRLHPRGLRRRITSASMLIGALACRALDQATVTAEAMELRGHRALQPLPPLRPGRADALLAVAAGLALAVGARLSWSGSAGWL